MRERRRRLRRRVESASAAAPSSRRASFLRCSTRTGVVVPLLLLLLVATALPRPSSSPDGAAVSSSASDPSRRILRRRRRRRRPRTPTPSPSPLRDGDGAIEVASTNGAEEDDGGVGGGGGADPRRGEEEEEEAEGEPIARKDPTGLDRGDRGVGRGGNRRRRKKRQRDPHRKRRKRFPVVVSSTMTETETTTMTTASPAATGCPDFETLSFDGDGGDDPLLFRSTSSRRGGGWHANYYDGDESYASAHSYASADSHSVGDAYALLSLRTETWQGLELDFDSSCLEVGKEYRVTAKVRLTKPSGVGDGGGVAHCESSGTDCLGVTLLEEDVDPATGGRTKTSIATSSDPGGGGGGSPSRPTTGDWYDFETTFAFDESTLSFDSTIGGGGGAAENDVRRAIVVVRLAGPEAGVDVAIDDLHFGPVDPTTEEEGKADGGSSSSFPPIPPGPYVTADRSSEAVTVPDPPEPVLSEGSARTGCPHLDPTLLSWHDPSTWGGDEFVPADGSDVVLPPSSRILVDRTVVETLGIVTVPVGTELIFGENDDGGISFDCRGIDVRGSLAIGSETCRIERSVVITLHGRRPADLDERGVSPSTGPVFKGIAATGGRLELHGKRYYRTWTRLAKTARPGDRALVLQHSVNWKPKQRIVLVTTALKDSRDWHRNEVLTVESVKRSSKGEVPEGVGSAIYLKEAVQHVHSANEGYQAEVGLLSRDVVVRGSESDSEPSRTDDGTHTDRRVYGNDGAPDPAADVDGYGGHIIVQDGGSGRVEGVELHRMGQTNVLGRYPMHFHLLGDGCDGCYLQDSSIHRSYHRCISIHGTHNATVTENVAYDVTGFCYYLEDGVEEDNVLSFNLAAHVHFLGRAPHGGGQTTPVVRQNRDLILPADIAASGFYVSNVRNDVIGNAASGGWAGFAFPILRSPVGSHRSVNVQPSSATSKTLDGNTAHSTGWWWGHSGGFYFGGTLYYDQNNTLVYNAGRDPDRTRSPCRTDPCAAGDCDKYCQPHDQAWIRLTNSKSFLTPSVGLNSWTGRLEVVGYEAHDVGLSLEALESGVWIDGMLAVCRTGEEWIMPPGSKPALAKGNGFVWYDTGQEHIITNSTFRNCGYRRSDVNGYDQFDPSPTRGCYDEPGHGCHPKSSVFGFMTHSDQFNPEVMQATKKIRFENCGRRFYLRDWRDYQDPPPPSTVSGRTQNWLDADGSASGLGVPTLVGSGLADAGLWWNVEDDATFDSHGPLWFVKKRNGPSRNLGHVKLRWDAALHRRVGDGVCGNGPVDPSDEPCAARGYVRHFGPRFASDDGLPVTANADVAGLTGGFGWLLELNDGAPKDLNVTLIEVDPASPLLLGVQYPPGVAVAVTAHAAWCSDSRYYSCAETFRPVASRAAVRTSSGNVYHLDDDGFFTMRIVMTAQTFTGNPDWILPDYDTVGKWGNGMALLRFSRGGVTLPQHAYGPWLNIKADCASVDGVYCSGTPAAPILEVCSEGYRQVSYDTCCLPSATGDCQDAASNN